MRKRRPIRNLPRSIPAVSAVALILAKGPTRIGTINPSSAASTAPERAEASHGCATAVGIGSSLVHLSSNCSYLPVPVSTVIDVTSCFRHTTLCCRSGFFQQKGENNCGPNAEQKRQKGRLVMSQFPLRGTTRYALQKAAKYRPQQSTEGEIQKVDYTVAVPPNCGGLTSLITV